MSSRFAKSFVSFASLLALPLAILSIQTGCGGTPPFIKTSGDYARVQPFENKTVEQQDSARGMAMLWGVIIDIEGLKNDAEAYIEPLEGDIGEAAEDTNATGGVVLGNVQIQLSSTDTNKFQLKINRKKYGRVKPGDRISVDHEREVSVNETVRESN